MNEKYSFYRFICALLIGAMLLSSFAVSSFAEDTGAEKIYYATITNPHDHEVTMPIEIKCGFAEGEVKSADYVHIYDSMDETQTLIPHRYEGEKNAAYFEKADLGFYADNSLKFGSFWIIDTLGSNETKTYALKISDVAHEKFTKRIEVKNNTSTTTNTTVTATYGDSKAVINFGKPADSLTGAYHLVELKHSSFDNKSVATRLGYLYILDDEGNRVYPFNDSSSYTMKRSWSLGDGAVYLDYTATAQANDGTIKYTTKYRVFANGLVICKNYAEALKDTTLYGFGTEHVIPTSERTVVNERDAHGYYLIGDTALKVTNTSLQSSSVSDKTFTAKYSGSVTKSGVTGNCVMRLNNSGYTSVSKNEVFYIETALNPDGLVADDLMTKLSTTAYKGTETELEAELIAKTKALLDDVYNTEITPGNNLKPLHAVNKIFAKQILEGEVSEKDVEAYLDELAVIYSECTAEDFQNVWKNAVQGIEYIGRNTNDLYDLRALCIKAGLTEQAERIEEIIHELADFYVWLENYSGGTGMVYLGVNSSNKDGLNPCASAMKAIYNSLRIKDNEALDGVYNRIFEKVKTGFVYDSYFLYKYSRTNAELGSQNHYHMYTSYELSDTPVFDDFNQSYLQATFSPSGRSRDLEYSYSSTRRGHLQNYTLGANLLYKKGGASNLKQAITLIDEISGIWDNKYLHSWPVNAGNDSRIVLFTQSIVNMLNNAKEEYLNQTESFLLDFDGDYNAMLEIMGDEYKFPEIGSTRIDASGKTVTSAKVLGKSDKYLRIDRTLLTEDQSVYIGIDNFKYINTKEYIVETDFRFSCDSGFGITPLTIITRGNEKQFTPVQVKGVYNTLSVSIRGLAYDLYNSSGKLLGVKSVEDNEFTKLAVLVNENDLTYTVYVDERVAYYFYDGQYIPCANLPITYVKGNGTKAKAGLRLMETDSTKHNYSIIDIAKIAVSPSHSGIASSFRATQSKFNISKLTFDLRFLAGVDSLYASNVGFVVETTYTDGSIKSAKKEFKSNVVYSSIVDESGTVKASDLNSGYLFVMSVTSIPVTTDGIDFTITPFVEHCGVRVYGKPESFVAKVENDTVVVK